MDEQLEPPIMHGREILRERILELYEECRTGEWAVEPWVNQTLPDYLEALAAILDGYENARRYQEDGLPETVWEIVADAMRGTRYYE